MSLEEAARRNGISVAGMMRIRTASIGYGLARDDLPPGAAITGFSKRLKRILEEERGLNYPEQDVESVI